MILNTMALIKYTMILSREQKIRDCLKLMEIDWKELLASGDSLKIESLMRENANVGRRLTRVCAVTFYMGGLSYRLIKTLLTPDIVTPSGLIVKPLPSPLYGVARYNLSSSPVYELIFAVQMIGGFAVHSTTITICSYAAILAAHACGQLDVVVLLLEKLVDGTRETLSRKITAVRLRTIVQRHLKVLQ